MDAAAPLATIVHRLPGRVRLRLPPGVDAEAARRLAVTLDGVLGARANRRARSMALSFDPAVTDPEALIYGLATHGPGSDFTSVPPLLADASVSGSLAAALAVQIAPAAARLPITAAATAPMLVHSFADWRENGLTSHALEGLAVGISLARADYTAATTTAFLLALGENLEEGVVRRADELLSGLLRPSGTTVWVVRDGAEVAIPADEVAVGDSVVVGAGDVIPVDGSVLSGEATVNEAVMTGESASVAKSRGAHAMSGTLIEEGRLVIYAEQVGARTACARIADYVERCLETKSDTQIEASRLADRLVPFVMNVAGGAFVLTGDWRRAASVLQADYGCALKLSTPVAFKSAMYAAGRSGILVKGAQALERLASADTFIFDKTGTLTTGLLEVTDAVTFDARYDPADLVNLAASVEEHYVHPLAHAVVAAARAIDGFRHFEHQEVQFVVAHGVASVIDGKRIVVGSRHFLTEHEAIDVTPHEEAIEALYREGKTVLYIGFGGKLLGLIALKDQVRSASASTVARLRALGVKRILMLTGDHRERAQELAEALGLDGFHAELLPEEKAGIVETLAAEGARIAFVGDGINDAPALAGAHVGIAMQRGADIARLTADIALLEDDIARIADAKEAALTTRRVIANNYRATLWLNTAILGAAALGLLSPIATAVLHNGSTIGLLLSSFGRRLGGRRRLAPQGPSPSPAPALSRA